MRYETVLWTFIIFALLALMALAFFARYELDNCNQKFMNLTNESWAQGRQQGIIDTISAVYNTAKDCQAINLNGTRGMAVITDIQCLGGTQ